MEIPNHHQEVEIPTPLNTSYSGIYNPTLQNHIIPTSAPTNLINNPSISTNLADNTHIVPYNNNNNKIKMVRYKECLKNHAASMGRTATDGCGEFMPSGEEGSIESLICSACHCHRNFHRKEIEGDPSSFDYFHHGPHFGEIDRKVLLGHHNFGPFGHMNVGPHGPRMLAYNAGSESDEEMGMPRQQGTKKRFRTRFSHEQKDKMMEFAEKFGWKIQKQEESVVQQFCQEIGVKRRVLKVWMHNNKHSLAKKNTTATLAQNPTI